jgi:hypothetical protein
MYVFVACGVCVQVPVDAGVAVPVDVKVFVEVNTGVLVKVDDAEAVKVNVIDGVGVYVFVGDAQPSSIASPNPLVSSQSSGFPFHIRTPLRVGPHVSLWSTAASNPMASEGDGIFPMSLHNILNSAEYPFAVW